jgi:hypothetical protein
MACNKNVFQEIKFREVGFIRLYILTVTEAKELDRGKVSFTSSWQAEIKATPKL